MRRPRDIVAGAKHSIPAGEFLIARSGQRGAQGGQYREVLLVALEQVSKSGALGHVDRFFGDAGQFASPPKEQHLDAEIWQDVRHRKIVT